MRVRDGAPRVYVMPRREGGRDNRKRVERVYRELGLSLRHKRPRRSKSDRRGQPKQSIGAVNEVWTKRRNFPIETGTEIGPASFERRYALNGS